MLSPGYGCSPDALPALFARVLGTQRQSLPFACSALEAIRLAAAGALHGTAGRSRGRLMRPCFRACTLLQQEQ